MACSENPGFVALNRRAGSESHPLRFLIELTFRVTKVVRMCHPETQSKDLAHEKEIIPLRLRSGPKVPFTQNDSVTVTLDTIAHFRHF